MSSYIITVKIVKLRFGQFSVHKSIINNGKYVQNICLLKTIMTELYQNHYTEQSITQHVCTEALVYQLHDRVTASRLLKQEKCS